MAITEVLYSFFKPRLRACNQPIDPVNSSMIKGLLIFVALTGTSAYYSLQFAEFCSTLPQIEFKTNTNITNVTNITHVMYPNATDILDDIDNMKNFINWFNHLEPYDICLYSSFGAASYLALTFSMAATSLFMLSHMELKKKPREGSKDRLFDGSKIENEELYSGLISASKKNERRNDTSQQRLSAGSFTFGS